MSTASFILGINIAQAITISIGLIGNLISIIIFSRKTFRNNSISTYCIGLSINELLYILKFVDNIGVLAFNSSPADQSDGYCKFFHYILNIRNGIQPCLLVAFSIDKLLSMRTSSIAITKKKWFQWSVVTGIFLFNILLYSQLAILVKRRELPGRFFCDLSTLGYLPIFMIMVVVVTCLIPFMIMITSSLLTIRLLIKSRKSVARNGNVAKDRKSRDQKYAVSSVAFNIMFLVLKTPFVIYYTWFAFFNYFDVYFFNITSFVTTLHSASFFFTHLVSNSLFRREFLVLIRLVKKNEEISSIKSSRTIALNRINPMS
jgi:hypothetical protein